MVSYDWFEPHPYIPHYLPIQYMYIDQNWVCYLIRVVMTKLWVRSDKLLQNDVLNLKLAFVKNL